MKNKILISIAVVLIAAGAFIFAQNRKAGSEICPNTPDCICQPGK